MENLPRIIQLPKIFDERGNLSYIEEEQQIPFKIKRVFWIYDVPGGEKRGGHAYKIQQELLIALSGSFDVVFNNGLEESRIHLNRSYFGVYIPNLIWRHLDNFSTNSIALFLASTYFDAHDYINDYNEYKELISNKLTFNT